MPDTPTVRALRDQMDELDEQILALHKDDQGNLREFTPAESKQFDTLRDERSEVHAQILKHEALAASAQIPGRRIEPDAGTPAAARSGSRWRANTNIRSSGPAWMIRDSRDGNEVRGRAMDALEQIDASDAAMERAHAAMLDQARRPQERNALAFRLAACSDPAYARAFSKMLVNPTNGFAMFTGDERQAWDRMLEAQEMERSTMAVGSGTAGAMVPTFLDPSVILTNDGTTNVIRQVARTVTLTNGANTWNGIASDGVTATFAAELTEVGDGSPTFADPSIPVQKAQAFVQASIEAVEDIASLGTEVMTMFSDAKDRLEETKYTVGAGSGSDEPMGVFTAVFAASGSHVVSTAAAAIAAADIDGVYLAVPARYRRKAHWLTNSKYALAVKGLGTAVSASYSGDLTQPAASRWLDLPVLESDDAPTTQTTTALDQEILLGDFSRFVIVDKLGMSVEFIPHLFNTSNNLPDGRRGWYAHWRTGSDVVDTNAFRMLVDKTSA